MNKDLKIKLGNVLKAEADYVERTETDSTNKCVKLNDILNLLKIIENYDELEPVLKKYFREKADRNRFDR